MAAPPRWARTTTRRMAPLDSGEVGSISMPRPSVTYAVPLAICPSSAGSNSRMAWATSAPGGRSRGPAFTKTLMVRAQRVDTKPAPPENADRLRKTLR